MKLRKRFLALCSTLLLLSACGEIKVPPIMGNGGDGGAKAPEQQGDNPDNPNKPENNVPVDTYLVLSSVGLYKGEKGKSIEEKMLENAVIYNALPGTDLPGKDDITTIDASKGEFDGWVCYEGTGFPTVYTKVPNAAGMILYATFKNGTSGGGSSSSSQTGTSTQYTTIYLDATAKLNTDNNETWASGGAAVTMHVWSYTTGDNAMIKMNNLNNGFYSADIDLGKYTNVIFLRHANDKEAKFEDGGYWNTSGDLLFVADKNCFKITSWNYSGVWTNK